MKKLSLFANWKSNKTKTEAEEWLNEFNFQGSENIETIILPPFTLLDIVSEFIKKNNLDIQIGAQDISPFGMGAYTGEVNGDQIKEFGKYVLIGHSERRSNFSETKELIDLKIQEAIKNNLIPVVCISDISELPTINSPELIVAYEPLAAIGTNTPEDPSLVSSVVNEIKSKLVCKVIYGGSVNSQNIKNYTNLDIDGVLVGGESLKASSFLDLINNAS